METKTKRPRISKRTREAAAHACALMASSNGVVWPSGEPTGSAVIYMPDAIDVASEAAALAREALWSVPRYDHDDSRERWAEAEAKLRCGWIPDMETLP